MYMNTKFSVSINHLRFTSKSHKQRQKDKSRGERIWKQVSRKDRTTTEPLQHFTHPFRHTATFPPNTQFLCHTCSYESQLFILAASLLNQTSTKDWLLEQNKNSSLKGQNMLLCIPQFNSLTTCPCSTRGHALKCTVLKYKEVWPLYLIRLPSWILVKKETWLWEGQLRP